MCTGKTCSCKLKSSDSPPVKAVTPVTIVHHAPDKLAARGVTLLTFGLIWAIIGIDVYFDPTDAGRTADLIYTRLPIWFRVIIWVGPGILALLAFRNRRLQPVAFGALVVAPAERLIAYGWAVLGMENWDRVGAALTYLIISLMVPLLGRATVAKPPRFIVLPEGVAHLQQNHPEWIIDTRADQKG